MYRTVFLVFLGLIQFSCKSTYNARVIDEISIQEFKIDSTSIRAIQVIDSETLYFAGSNGKIGFTNDAGKNWSTHQIVYRDTIIPNFRSIAFNGKDVFAMSIENPALLYKISNNEPHLVYSDNHPKVFYDSMLFFDEKNGIAMGDPTEDCLSVIYTENSGKSWQKITCNNIPVAKDGEAAFAASNTNLTSIGNTVWMASGGNVSRVYKSSDKGKTWRVFDTPIVQGSESQGIYSVDFYDENRGIIIGGDYIKPNENLKNKAITKDGGKIWQLVAEGKEPNYKSCVQYIPNSDGKEIIAVGKTGISFSNDGGHTWKKISDEAYYTIQFIDSNTAWLSGNNKIGKIIFSSI